jgi:hypothetical protein
MLLWVQVRARALAALPGVLCTDQLKHAGSATADKLHSHNVYIAADAESSYMLMCM